LKKKSHLRRLTTNPLKHMEGRGCIQYSREKMVAWYKMGVVNMRRSSQNLDELEDRANRTC
jgi:hypothetical protein